jgi:hypothetical protein
MIAIKNLENNFECEKKLIYESIDGKKDIKNNYLKRKSNNKNLFSKDIYIKNNRLLRSNIRSTSSIDIRSNKTKMEDTLNKSLGSA